DRRRDRHRVAGQGGTGHLRPTAGPCGEQRQGATRLCVPVAAARDGPVHLAAGGVTPTCTPGPFKITASRRKANDGERLSSLRISLAEWLLCVPVCGKRKGVSYGTRYRSIAAHHAPEWTPGNVPAAALSICRPLSGTQHGYSRLWRRLGGRPSQILAS